jgi:hypothetical protein
MIRSHLIRCLFALLAVSVLATSARAGKVKLWHHHTPSHFEKARRQQVVVTNEGTLRLARQLRPLARLEAAHVWAVLEDADGHLVVATGDEGKIFRVSPDGKCRVLHTCEDSQVLCLARGHDGAIYAGTGPRGMVLRIDAAGARAHFLTRENYVWSLAPAPDGRSLLAGTGPKGRIYRITPGGEGSVFCQTRQEHVLALAAGTNGMVYAGTDKDGLLYRIDAKGQGFVLFGAPQAEVRSLLVTAEGVYAGTGAPIGRRGGSSNSGGSRASDTGSSGVSATPTSTTRPSARRAASEPDTGKAAEASPESSKGSPAAAPAPPAGGENSLYRVTPDGSVREVFREKALLLSLVKQGERLLVGTGTEGQLFEVHTAKRERSEIARLDHGHIHCLHRRRDGSIVLGTVDPGQLYVLDDRFVGRGTILSPVLDAKLPSRWGALRWQAETPDGTTATLAVRSGNVAEPDETWSTWSSELADPQRATAMAPLARYLQYRVTLTSANPTSTPAVRDVTLRYLPANQAPEVTAIDVPDLDAVNVESPKRLKLKWTATDANEDELTYRLLIRKDGWNGWAQLEEAWEKREYEWDTTTVPSGVYRLRVVASDRKDNADADALSAERESAPFVVSHVPPTVTARVVRVRENKALIEAKASGPYARLTAASYAVNGRKWKNVFPMDALFDNKEESFRFETEAVAAGAYVLVLRVRDAAGNVGAGDVVFSVGSAGKE